MALFITAFFVLWATGAIATLLREGMFPWVVSEFLLCGLVAVVFMSVMFLAARKIGRYDLVDAAWGMSFISVALTSFLLQPGEWLEPDLQLLVTVLVIVWGGRLSWHILRRIQRTAEEDPRYVELRKTWRGNVAANIYIRIYLLQAVLALLICVPVIHINLFADNGITPLAWVGVAVWAIGFFFETVGDRQLRDFVSRPANKGKIMDRGLWRYTRHPNYFGELTQWWGIFLMCLTTPFGFVGIIGPVLISYLILYVSGIPLNEKRFEGRPGWARYKARTSGLIPLPPRSA
jgi:steroid 5-alpha reductase family enzyme